MMDKLIIPTWGIVGVGIAFLFLKSQWWSVMVIQPGKPKRGKWIIIGGAVIRWFILAIVFIAAVKFSIIALIIVFVSFMAARISILFLWQKSFNADGISIH